MSNSGNNQTIRLILLLTLLVVGFRVVYLRADPPADFSWSGGYFADEGFWSHNARNEALFGSPVMDEWNAAAMSPLFAGLQRWIFRILGPGLVQVRLIGMLSAVLIAISTFLLIRKHQEPAVAFGISVLVALNFPMLVLARQGILDPFASALAMCAALAMMSDSFASRLFSGILLLFAIVTKYLMVYTLFPFLFFLISPLFHPGAENESAKTRVFPFAAGIVLCGFVWFFLTYLPNLKLIGGYTEFYSSQQVWGIGRVMKNVITQPFYLYFIKSPVLLFFGNLFFWSLVLHWKTAHKSEKFFWFWLASGILFFALWSYRPLRYYTSLLPPLAVLAGFALTRIGWLTDSLCARKERLLVWLGILLPAVQFVFVLLDRWAAWGIIPDQLGVSHWSILIYLILTIVVPTILLKSKNPLKLVLVIFVTCFLVTDMKDYVQWKINRQYAALHISRDLENRVGAGTVTGQWAPELCLENHVKNIPVWHGFVNDRDPFARFGITHVLQWEYELGGEQFSEWYPKEFSKFHEVARYRIKNSDLVLYEKKQE